MLCLTAGAPRTEKAWDSYVFSQIQCFPDSFRTTRGLSFQTCFADVLDVETNIVFPCRAQLAGSTASRRYQSTVE